MPTRIAQTLWWQLTPVQRALLRRIARDGVLDRLMPWEGRTVRSLIARDLLRRGGRDRHEHAGAVRWVLTAKARRVLSHAAETPQNAVTPQDP